MGIKRAVIDANVLLALIDEKDKWHSKASLIAKALKRNNWNVVYLDCVLNEVVSVLGRRLEERKDSHTFLKIVNRFEELVPEAEIEWIYPNVPEIYRDIIKLIKEKNGKLNFHDALISLFMKDQDLEFITSFDMDFDDIEGIVRLSDAEEIR